MNNRLSLLRADWNRRLAPLRRAWLYLRRHIELSSGWTPGLVFGFEVGANCRRFAVECYAGPVWGLVIWHRRNRED
jgi:hypothetical protein